MMKLHGLRFWTCAAAITAALAVTGTSLEAQGKGKGRAKGTPRGAWLAGDFHQHTSYTDGLNSYWFVAERNVEFGLDWWANSEHGGYFSRDGQCDGHRPDPGACYWDEMVPNPILGDPAPDRYDGQSMWRWQSLLDYAFSDTEYARFLYSDKRIAQGVEWNVPGHEHCSVGIISEDGQAVSAFEYMFDAGDRDTSREGEITPFGTLAKNNFDHESAVAACAWMQEQWELGNIDEAWVTFAHPERKGFFDQGGYDINHFRDLNNAGPDVCFGFEGAPGHQPSGNRGGFGTRAHGGTYGGTGFYTAKVGGLWDALLGEGRRWFNFASSDYHGHFVDHGWGDFYPGEYQKNWSYVVDSDRNGDFSLIEIAQSLSSGNSFHVMGDLIDALEVEAWYKNDLVAMGGELMLPERTTAPLKVKIRFSSPPVNHNGDVPIVDHIDVIAGDIYGMIEPGSPGYDVPENPSARVVQTLELEDFEYEDGFYEAVLTIQDPKSMLWNGGGVEGFYLRLRGTNMNQGTPFETDEFGNPLADFETEVLGYAPDEEAWIDLWFYSNPIFVYFN